MTSSLLLDYAGGGRSDGDEQLTAVSVRLPRILLRDPLGRVLDTETSLQRTILLARRRQLEGLPPSSPTQWRLPHAPAPARPDYSRLAPPKVTERIERQDTLVRKRRTVDNLPNLLETSKQDWSSEIQHYGWQLQQLEGQVPLEMVTWLYPHQQPVTSSRVFLPLLGVPPLIQRDHTDGALLSHRSPGAGVNTGDTTSVSIDLCRQRHEYLCYGCDLCPRTHYHNDKLARTGGGFTYFKRSKTMYTMSKHHPLAWSLPADGSFTFLEGAQWPDTEKYGLTMNVEQAVVELADPEFVAWLERKKTMLSDLESSQLHLPSEYQTFLSQQGREGQGDDVIPRDLDQDSGRGQSPPAEVEDAAKDETQSAKERPKLYKAPEAFKPKLGRRQVTEGKSPFSTDRKYNISKGKPIDIKKSDKPLTEFVDVHLNRDGWKEPTKFELKDREPNEITEWQRPSHDNEDANKVKIRTPTPQPPPPVEAPAQVIEEIENTPKTIVRKQSTPKAKSVTPVKTPKPPSAKEAAADQSEATPAPPIRSPTADLLTTDTADDISVGTVEEISTEKITEIPPVPPTVVDEEPKVVSQTGDERRTSVVKKQSASGERRRVSVKTPKQDTPPAPEPVVEVIKPKTPEPEPEPEPERGPTPVQVVLPSPPSPIPPVQLPRKIELPPLPSVPLPEPPTLPEYFESVKPQRELTKTTIEVPPPMPDPPTQRRPPPVVKPKKKPKEVKKKKTVTPTAAPVPADELREMGDPLDFLAKYCIVHPDRLPLYEHIFEQSVRAQNYRYSEVPHPPGMYQDQVDGNYGNSDTTSRQHTEAEDLLRRLSTVTPYLGDTQQPGVNSDLDLLMPPHQQPVAVAAKDTLTSAERTTIEHFQLVKKPTALDGVGMNDGDIQVKKLNYTLDMLIDKYESLQAKLEQLTSDRMHLLAAAARTHFPQILDEKKKKKTKKHKVKGDHEAGGGGDEDGAGGSASKRSRDKFLPPSDEEIVSRLNDKMLKELYVNDELRLMNTEIELLSVKLKVVDDRIERIEDQKKIMQLYGRDRYREEESENVKPEEFRRQQSALYQRLHPDRDFEMNLVDVEDALLKINGQLLGPQEMHYIYYVLNLPGRKRVNMETFCAIAALSEKVAQVDPFIRKLMKKMDFEALNIKMDKCKELFRLLAENDSVGQSDVLSVELAAGGVTTEHTEYVLNKFDRDHKGTFDFLDFLIYVPLFIELHSNIIANPLIKERTI